MEKVMMKKTVFIAGVIMSVLILGHCAQGGVSVVANGSFENDGQTIADINEYVPYGWHDVDMDVDKFGGYVDDTVWVSNGDYSLTLFSRRGLMS